jgi:hypothetical protein
MSIKLFNYNYYIISIYYLHISRHFFPYYFVVTPTAPTSPYPLQRGTGAYCPPLEGVGGGENALVIGSLRGNPNNSNEE